MKGSSKRLDYLSAEEAAVGLLPGWEPIDKASTAANILGRLWYE
jgi:hypothetical protein